MCILGLEICQFIGDKVGFLQLDYMRSHGEENCISKMLQQNVPFNLNAATVLFDTVGNSLSLRCSEKPAFTLFIFTAKLSSACINMNNFFFNLKIGYWKPVLHIQRDTIPLNSSLGTILKTSILVCVCSF